MFIFYDLHFDGIDYNIVNNDEHDGDFDAFSLGHSQYLTFSFDGDGFGNKRSLSLDRFSIYIQYSFTRSMS